MMLRRALWLLPTLVLLAACSRSGPADQATASPVVVPATSGTATNGSAPSEQAKPATSDPRPPATQDCRWVHNTPEVGGSLRQYVADALANGGKAGLAAQLKTEPDSCLRIEQSEEAPVMLVQGYVLGPGVVVWQSGSGWQVAPFDKGYSDVVLFGKVHMAEGRPDGFLIGASTGSGGAKSILHLTIDPAGKATAKPATPAFGRSIIDFFGLDLALITHRHQLWEEFPDSCNGCVPSLEQVLVRWNGTEFQVIGTRTAPDPQLTLNHLRIALEKGDQATAARLVSDPALLPQARQLLVAPQRRQYVQFEHGWGPIPKAERYNWTLLPEGNRQDLPPELQHISYIVDQGGRFALQLKRTPEQWVLAGIHPLKPGEVPADAPKQ